MKDKMNKSEMLDIARVVASGDTVLERALQRYNAAAADMATQSSWLSVQAGLASARASDPNNAPTLDTDIYTSVAIKLAIAEQATWQALYDIAAALEEAGYDVNW
jgi:hypothetical protein